MPPQQTMLDTVATDLALWIDQESTRIAAAMAPQGVAPFAAQLSETQKLEYYRDQLFNPDGTPNLQGRQQEMQRLGPQGFTQVYKAVLKAYPQLKLPTPPGMPGEPITQATPPEAPSGVPVPMVPRGVASAQVSRIVPIVPAMAGGGIVTQPTVALIGEAGPEAVVPLTPSRPADAIDRGQPTTDEINQYIAAAAQQRGIDPGTALAVAFHEGTASGQPNARGTFSTGSSWWPFQLHYGGTGYEQYGTTPGLGNDFTAQTGWQPGDPRAWRAATDYALDVALQRGWYPTFYGSVPAGVAPRQGLPSVPQTRA